MKLHFLESFFSPLFRPHTATVWDAGCSTSPATASCSFRISISFRHARGVPARGSRIPWPPSQRTGKTIAFNFSPKVNYAEVRAIEVTDEAK